MQTLRLFFFRNPLHKKPGCIRHTARISMVTGTAVDTLNCRPGRRLNCLISRNMFTMWPSLSTYPSHPVPLWLWLCWWRRTGIWDLSERESGCGSRREQVPPAPGKSIAISGRWGSLGNCQVRGVSAVSPEDRSAILSRVHLLTTRGPKQFFLAFFFLSPVWLYLKGCSVLSDHMVAATLTHCWVHPVTRRLAVVVTWLMKMYMRIRGGRWERA